MQKAEPQQAKIQNQPAAKKSGGVAVESPQNEEVAQLEAMIETSPQMERLGSMAAMMSAGTAMAAQRKLADMMHNSQRQQTAQKFAEGINGSPLMVAQRKKIDGLFGAAQRVEEEEFLQGKFTSEAPAQLKAEPAAKPNNTGLPENLKSGIENLSGMAMDNVKVHYNSSQPAQLNALAYAQGTDIHVAPGQEQHLPHEAWHVVQQAQGRVRLTMQMKDGVPVNDDQGLEHEADVMGERAISVNASAANNAEKMGTLLQRGLNPPVQKLVVAGEDQDNLTVASALPAATTQAGGPVQDWGAANLAGAGRVAIVAHGDVNTIILNGQEYDGTQLAERLIAKHIEPNSTLLLWACRAGMQNMVQGVSVDGSSLVENTAAALSGHIDNVTVNGFRGVHMFLPGDGDASRIIDPALTADNPVTEETWLHAIGALNMHYVYLSGYFSERYLVMHMAGWQQQDVAMPFGHNRRLWIIGDDVFGEHTSDQTQVEFRDKEMEAHHPPLIQPHWLANQETFNEYKRNLWRAAGMNLTADADFDLATLRESEETHGAMTRTAVSTPP